SPKLIDDITFIPIRSLIEALGGNVGWDDIQSKITINLKSKKIDMFVNSNKAIINGKEVVINVPPRIINNRTMIPLRFVIENLGLIVLWDSDNQKIEICYK
ncbi:MAG: hypothetical protein K0R31_595, partial [Clostridiales bacterium]|nr:hypothetical protein [Clostridiales bacterium]